MPRSKRSHALPVSTWTGPHCGFVHRPADLLRTGWDTLQCKGCQKVFDSKPDPEYKKR